MSASNILRFACGAVSPPFDGSFEGWIKAQIKDLKGYALGHRRKAGRREVVGKPKRSSPFRQIKILCYPEEVLA